MNEKVQLLEASIELLKEKLKANDFSKSNLENRVSSIESRMSIIMNGSSKVEKENLTNLDVQLSNSQLFASSLKRMDGNVTSNLRKLEEHFGDALRESQSKFSEIEQRMLGILTQKQKILRNLTFQLQNQAHSIAAIEQWIKSDHQQINSIHLVEQNVRQKVEIMQKNAEMKGEILMEKIRFLQQFQQSVIGNLKNVGSKYEEFDQKLKVFKKEAKKEFTEIEEKLDDRLQKYGREINEKILRSAANSQSKRQSKFGDQEENFNEVKRKINNLTNKLDDYDQKFTKANKKIALLEEKLQTLSKDIVNQQRTQNRNKTISNQTERIFSSGQQKPTFQDMNYSSKKAKQQKQSERFAKKELPPRKNLFQQNLTSQNNQEDQIPQMRGGIRGLLQKSKDKDKQRQGLLKTNDPLNRKQQTSSRKGLPPVKEDPLAKKKKESKGGKYQSQAEEETTVYQIDEEGYLMDEEGNYLLDETGAMIRLSPEQIQEYMMEQQY